MDTAEFFNCRYSGLACPCLDYLLVYLEISLEFSLELWDNIFSRVRKAMKIQLFLFGKVSQEFSSSEELKKFILRQYQFHYCETPKCDLLDQILNLGYEKVKIIS